MVFQTLIDRLLWFINTWPLWLLLVIYTLVVIGFTLGVVWAPLVDRGRREGSGPALRALRRRLRDKEASLDGIIAAMNTVDAAVSMSRRIQIKRAESTEADG